MVLVERLWTLNKKSWSCAGLLMSTSLWASLPVDAQKVLDQIPGKALSAEFVLLKALENSDAFKKIVSSAPSVEATKLAAEAPHDWYVIGGAGYLNNQNESDSPFGPIANKGFDWSLGVQKNMAASGSRISALLQQSNFETELSPSFSTPENPYDTKQAKFTLSVEQSLLKNSFGTSSRKTLEAAGLQSESQKYALMNAAENYVHSVVNLFYSAWMAKVQFESSVETHNRQKKLSSSIRIQSQRGSADRVDVLQVQNALATAENQVALAKQNLQDTWNYLVINLKLPKEWMNISAELIPLALDNPIPEAMRRCKLGGIHPELSKVRSAALSSTSAQLLYEASKSEALPDLNLKTMLTWNGVDSVSAATGLNEAFSGEHPSYYVGLNFSLPLGFKPEKAKLYMQTASRKLAEYDASIAKSDAEVQWKNECQRVSLLEKNLVTNKNIAQSQKERVRLEEKRFENGRVSLMQVNLAGQEATGSEIAYQSNQIELRKSSWVILQLSGAVLEKLKSSKVLNLSRGSNE